MTDTPAPETRDCKYCDEPEGEPHRQGCPASDPPVGKDSIDRDTFQHIYASINEEPPVGKDSSFEEQTKLLDAFGETTATLGSLYEKPFHNTTNAEVELAEQERDAARAALESLFAKQREEIERLGAFSRTPYLSANRDLEAKLAASYLAIERRDAQVASLQSEIERQRGEIKELEGEIGEWSERWNSRDRSFGELWDENTSLRALHSEMVERLQEERDRFERVITTHQCDYAQVRKLEDELARQRETTLTARQASALRYITEDTGIPPEELSPEEIQDALRKLRLLSSSPLT